MDFALESPYRKLIRFSYTSFDRIVVRGHDRALQAPAGFLWWCQRLRPDQPITDAWIGSLARRFHEGAKNFASENHIPVVTAYSGMDKFETAAEYRAKRTKPTGVYLILRARETATTYRSVVPRNAQDSHRRFIIKRRGFVDQYYFYLVDPYWGPIAIRISSHPPFNVTVYLNGNRWLAQEAVRRGLNLATKDNSVVRCDDPEALQAVADSLTHDRIQSVCDHWVYRLLPALTREERIRSFFRYRWFLYQVEMSHNMVFRNATKLTETLERHVDLNRRTLHPYSLKTIFDSSPAGRYKKPIEVSVRHAFGGLTVLSARYGNTRVKQYNNHQQTLRTEVCANDTTDLGVNKAIENLPALRRRLLQLITQFQQAQAAVLHTSCNRGELAALAKPGQVNQVATPGIKLENERIMAALAALPQLAHQPDGFRSADVRPIVHDSLRTDYTAPQANYDLRKLRGKGLVDRIDDTRRYRLTAEGLRVTVLLCKLRDQLLCPLLSIARRKRRTPRPRRPLAEPDRTHHSIAEALFRLCQQLALEPAA